jgi:hypothetical protein
VLAGFELKRPQVPVAPARDRGSLAALSERGKREEEGGGVGDL